MVLGVEFVFIPYDLWPFLIWRHVHSELDGQGFNSHIGRFPYLQISNHLSVCFFVSPNLWMCFVSVPLNFGSHFFVVESQKICFSVWLQQKNITNLLLGLEIFGDLPHIQCHFVGAQKNRRRQRKGKASLWDFEVGKCWGWSQVPMCVWEMKGAGCCMDVIYGCFWRPRPSWNIIAARGLLWWCACTF